MHDVEFDLGLFYWMEDIEIYIIKEKQFIFNPFNLRVRNKISFSYNQPPFLRLDLENLIIPEMSIYNIFL